MKWKMAAVSLIEVLVAVAVLSIGIVALLKFQANLLKDRVIAAQQAEALHLARSYMADTNYSENFYLIDIPGQGGTHARPASGSYSQSAETATYNVSRVITDYASPEYRTITVVVTWTDPNGTSRNVSIGSVMGVVDPNKVGEVYTEM